MENLFQPTPRLKERRSSFQVKSCPSRLQSATPGAMPTKPPLATGKGCRLRHSARTRQKINQVLELWMLMPATRSSPVKSLIQTVKLIPQPPLYFDEHFFIWWQKSHQNLLV